MEVLHKLQETLGMSEAELQEMLEVIGGIETHLRQQSILLTEQVQVGFYSHMVSFIRRLKNGEQVMEIGKEVADQLEERAIQIAEEITAPLFERYHAPINLSEILLIAIHIQAATLD